MSDRTSAQIPQYRLHKPTGCGVVRLNGRDIYLGTHGTPESKERYPQVIAEWLANNRQPGLAQPPLDQGHRTLVPRRARVARERQLPSPRQNAISVDHAVRPACSPPVLV